MSNTHFHYWMNSVDFPFKIGCFEEVGECFAKIQVILSVFGSIPRVVSYQIKCFKNNNTRSSNFAFMIRSAHVTIFSLKQVLSHFSSVKWNKRQIEFKQHCICRRKLLIFMCKICFFFLVSTKKCYDVNWSITAQIAQKYLAVVCYCCLNSKTRELTEMSLVFWDLFLGLYKIKVYKIILCCRMF